MTTVSDARMYARFALGLPGYFRHSISASQAEATIRWRLQHREANFLRLAERGIFRNPRSPYRHLLRLAGCELQDLHALVRDLGLEGALRTLRAAGVYVSFEEFKGVTPIVRHGRVLPIRPRAFDNPFLSHAYQSESGGTTAAGAGSRVEIDLDHLLATAPYRALVHAAHGIQDAPAAVWGDVLPDPRAIAIVLQSALLGNVPRRWFAPGAGPTSARTRKFRLATYAVLVLAMALRKRLPWPTHVPLERADVVARWAVDTVRFSGTCVLRMPVSMALRVSLAAREEGLGLDGVVFVGGGEPPTAAKVAEITRGGARWIPMYWFTEAGPVGAGCARPRDGNDLHLLEDSLALVAYPRVVPGFQHEVPAFCFTTLLPTAPKLLLNVESDDYGTLDAAPCGCPLERCGLVTHLRHVRSFRKLTGEGVTLVGSDMVRILEEVLPARFGGSPLDYQLLEEEDERGFTRLSLVVSPRVRELDEREAIAAILGELARGSVAAEMARAVWAKAGTLRVKRDEPVWTARGKLLPLHLARRSPPLDSGAADAGPPACFSAPT